MATPVGNPDISLLPQPSVPTPIEPMRGGGAEDVSLLPQPAAPTPIEPMRGGFSSPAPENVSLLPQPVTPAPIIAMKGGGDKIPTLELVEFRRQFPLDELKRLEVQLKVKEHITPYIDNLRRPLWGAQFPTSFDDSLKTLKLYSMDNARPTVVFFVRDFTTYNLAEKNIRTQLSRNVQSRFVFISMISEKSEFSKCYKRFISFVSKPEYRANTIFFLFDKTKYGIEWIKDESPAKAKFLLLEPDGIDFTYTEAGVAKHLLLLPTKTVPSDLKENYIILTSTEISENKLILPKKKEGEKEKAPFLVNTLKDKGVFSIDTKGKETYFDSYYLSIRYKDIPTTEPIPAKTGTTAPPPPPPPPKPVEYILKKKETEDFDLGGIVYQIRKATIATQTEWEEGTFTESEQALFNSLGLTTDFFTTQPSPEKEKLKAGRAKLLMSLTLSGCFKDTQYLLHSECEFVRDYLQSLLEIRQMERLRAVSDILGTFEDTAFTVVRSPAKAAAASAADTKGKLGSIFENINALFKSFDFTRKSSKKPGANLSSALGSSSGAATTAAAAMASGVPEIQIDTLLGMLAPSKKSSAHSVRLNDIDFTDVLTF
jgi:hypothetical protein